MKQSMNSRFVAPLSAILGAGVALLSATLVGAQSSDRPRANQAISIEGVVPRSRIINFDQGLARFDSGTGAMARLNGNLDNASTQMSWSEFAPGVSGSSGLMEIQQPRGVGNFADATFLVDIVTGDTWVLRRRGSNATWDVVR